MTNSDGGFSPSVIPDVAIPMLNTSFANTNVGSGAAQMGTVDSGMKPSTVKDAAISAPPVASEVIATSLDTQQRIILGSFVFGKVGALKVGSYVAGVSGEINISPNGLSAINSSNVTTFALDGTTGSATFAGSIISGSIITGSVSVGNGNVVIDGVNKRIIINDGVNDRVLIGYQLGGF